MQTSTTASLKLPSRIQISESRNEKLSGLLKTIKKDIRDFSLNVFFYLTLIIEKIHKNKNLTFTNYFNKNFDKNIT
jgi:hypothetical protein